MTGCCVYRVENVHFGLWEVWLTFCLRDMNRAGVCLLKGPIDRPEAWAFPAERLLTALTALRGAACQQLPLSINQQLQVSTAFRGEQRSVWRWGGTSVLPPEHGFSQVFFHSVVWTQVWKVRCLALHSTSRFWYQDMLSAMSRRLTARKRKELHALCYVIVLDSCQPIRNE